MMGKSAFTSFTLVYICFVIHSNSSAQMCHSDTHPYVSWFFIHLTDSGGVEL